MYTCYTRRGTHTGAATGAAPGLLMGARDVVSRWLYVQCVVVYLSRSPPRLSLSLSLPLSPPSPGSALWRLVARVFYQSLFFFLIFFFLVYTHYYYYCILGKRPREERGSRGTTSRRLRASSRTGPARVNNNKTKRGLVCTPTHAHDRDKGHPNDIYAANK